MNVLANDYILKTLDLPTIEWKPYTMDTDLPENLLWTIKVEELPVEKAQPKEPSRRPRMRYPWRRYMRSEKKALIGVDAKRAKEFGERMQRDLIQSRQILLYYPYYTAQKSGILDINRNRIVIEGTSGDIQNLLSGSMVEVTMIFTDDNVEITGDERFFTSEEILPIIDHAREVRKMLSADLDQNQNIQLYFSYVYCTNENYHPEGERQLVYYKYKQF